MLSLIRPFLYRMTDDDVAGFTIVELEGSTSVTEAGTTDTFTVVLDAQPDSDVVLSIISSDTGEATVTSSLTFYVCELGYGPDCYRHWSRR